MRQFESSTLTRLSTGLLSIALCRRITTGALMLTVATVVVGCASSAQHRSGALGSEEPTSKSAQVPVTITRSDSQQTTHKSPIGTTATTEESPPASPVFTDGAAHEANEERAASPVFTDEAAQEANEEPMSDRERFRDEGSEAVQGDEAPGHEKFRDDTSPAAEEKTFGQPFAEEQASPREDGAVEQRFSDEAADAKDESTAPQHFTEDAGTAKDEEPGASRFADEAAGPAREEVPAPEAFKDEQSGTASEELVRPPESFTDDEKLVQDEQVKPPAATILPMTITVETDPLFDFDRYAIRAESRKELDRLVEQLKGVSYGEVIAVGFADPIGTKLYNQNLSQRRAESVEQYLVSKGIPADRVRVEARGQTEEFASYRNCDGHGKQNLIDCLQPDRRVEVTVTAGKLQ